MEEASQRADDLQSELQKVRAGMAEEVAALCAAEAEAAAAAIAEAEAAAAAAAAEAEAAREEAAAARAEAGVEARAEAEEELVQLRESLQAQTTATVEAGEGMEQATEQVKEGAAELEVLRPHAGPVFALAAPARPLVASGSGGPLLVSGSWDGSRFLGRRVCDG